MARSGSMAAAATPTEAHAVPSTSGKSLIVLRDYLEHHHGQGAFEYVLRSLEPRHARAFDGIVLPTTWYPTESMVAMLKTARTVFGPEDLYQQHGEWSARFAINVVYRFLMKLKSPTWIMDKAATIWPNYHTTGRWEIAISRDRKFRAVFHDFAIPGVYCEVMIGWIRRAGLLTGAKHGTVEHPSCRARGDAECVFTGFWV